MKSRAFHSNFFTDPFVETLTVREKYAYIYYLFNSRMNWLGTYELSDRTALFELSTDGEAYNQEELTNLKDKLEAADKAKFEGNYVILKNSDKYDGHLQNKQLMKSALVQFKLLPENIKQVFIEYKPKDVVGSYLHWFSLFGYELSVGYNVDYTVGYSVDEVISNKKQVINNNEEVISKSESKPIPESTRDILRGKGLNV